MKKGKIVLLVILGLLLALVASVFIYCYPRWQSAASLQDNMDLEHFTYDIELGLDEKALSAEVLEAFETMSQITGLDADNFYDIRIAGSVWEDKIFVQLYTQASKNAVLELYLSEDADIVNGTTLYNSFRQKLVGDSTLLGGLVPTMEEGVYMTVEQAEKMFGLDLSILSDFAIDTGDLNFSQQEYFILLALMSREKQGDGNMFTFAYETAEAKLAVADEDDFAASARIAVENPVDVVEQLEEKLASFHVEIPTEGMEVFKSIGVAVEPGAGQEITIPTNIMSDEMIQVLAEVRALIAQFSGN